MDKSSPSINLLNFLLLLGLAFLLAPLFTESEYWLGTLILMLLNSAMAVSLRMILKAGQFHVCHAAFMGIGAYSSAILVNEAGLSSWIALPIAAGITAFVGLIIGFISLRLKGLYFFFVTLCLGEMFRLGIVNGPRILGAYTGITTTPIDPIEIAGFLTIDFTSRIWSYYFVFLLATLAVAVAYRIDAMRYGNILKGLKENETLLESLGVNVMLYKLQSFIILCAIAGLMGGFWAHYFLVVAIEDYGIWTSIYFFVYNQVGGLGSVAGPVVGAISLTVLREWLRAAQQLEPIIFGIILIVSFYFIPNGLISLDLPIVSFIEKAFGVGKGGWNRVFGSKGA